MNDVALDPAEWRHAFVVDADQVFRTTNAGTSWTDVTGDLFTAHAPGTVTSVAFVPDAVASGVVVGTNGGVFVARAPAYATWARLGSGVPNAPVYHLDYDPPNDVLVAATLGRGAWQMSNVTQALDLTPPAVVLTASRTVLWPARGAILPVLSALSVTDDFDPPSALSKSLGVYSNEAGGDGLRVRRLLHPAGEPPAPGPAFGDRRGPDLPRLRERDRRVGEHGPRLRGGGRPAPDDRVPPDGAAPAGFDRGGDPRGDGRAARRLPEHAPGAAAALAGKELRCTR